MLELLVEVISTTVNNSSKLFDMRKMKSEVMRIERVEKGNWVRKELMLRLRLESERRENLITRNKASDFRNVREVMWDIVDGSVRNSEKRKRAVEQTEIVIDHLLERTLKLWVEKLRLEEVERKRVDEEKMRKIGNSLLRKRKGGPRTQI